MANTYTQLNMHAVFCVKGRSNCLTQKIRPELHKYISGILTNLGQYSLAVNGYKDHVHIFFEMNPDTSLSDIMQVVKSNSSKWINDNKMVAGKFQWQKGFGGFSYSRSQRNNVIQYIMNQEEHHREKTFREEYLEFLEQFEVDFDERYLFEFYE
ncbi:MAG TPA: IS200/IS605 family transposase [Bacteroidales bacterium]|nr:IS200/IS605 family transposase [Bacteroidales bacterium]